MRLDISEKEILHSRAAEISEDVEMYKILLLKGGETKRG